MGFKDFVREHTTMGVRRALRDLRDELQIQHRHFASLRKAKRWQKSTDLKLHLGCGPYLKNGWINVDMAVPEADLRLDLREAFPFLDDSVSFVHCEHFFEHLDYPSPAMSFLKECWRVLKPGAALSLGVPDTEWPVMSYASADHTYFDLARERFHPKWCNTRMHNLNYHFRQGREHKYAYDLETLQKILEEAGFVSVERRRLDPEFDSPDRMVESLPWNTAGLYVNAHKPSTLP